MQSGVMVLDNGSRMMVPVEPGCFLSSSMRTEVTLQECSPPPPDKWLSAT